MQQVSQELSAAAQLPAVTSRGPGATPKGGEGREKVHAGRYVHDAAYDEVQHDLGPWMETPSSSRVSRFRYDYQNEGLQVQWRNNSNHGYIYLEVPYEGFRNFARVASKGRYVNSHLNNYEYRLMTDEEVHAPSNTSRSTVSRRKE